MGASSFKAGATRGRGKYRPVSDINVTPFIDVMLVLLIVFMVTAPMLTAGVKVDLPKSEAGAIKEEDQKPIEVTIRDDGSIFIGEQPVTEDRLVTILSSITNNDFDRRIFLRGDRNLPYGQVMRLIGAINKAGYGKVALISEAAAGKR